jgi:rhodanese-related sulfurtransferase
MHQSVHDLHAVLDDAFVLDVREPDEYEQGHVPGAKLMPLATVPVRHGELPRDQTIWVVCASGGRSFSAAAWLAQQGYDVRNVSGGTFEWVAAGLPVTHGPES